LKSYWDLNQAIYYDVYVMCDYRRGMDWILDLVISYTHHSELPVTTALLLISPIHKSPQNPLSLFQLAVS
jgi:hypothetical protein